MPPLAFLSAAALLPGASLLQECKQEGSRAAEHGRAASFCGSRQLRARRVLRQHGKWEDAGLRSCPASGVILEHRRCKKIFLPPSAVRIPVAGTAC